MRDGERGREGGREESQNERASEMGGAEDRLLLRTARRGGRRADIIPPAEREREGSTLESEAELSCTMPFVLFFHYRSRLCLLP